MELTAAMNARYSDRTQVQKIGQEILRESTMLFLAFSSLRFL
jgi:hypothetical protein